MPEVRRDEAVGVEFGVLDEDLAGFDAGAVVALDGKPAAAVPGDAVLHPGQELGLAVAIAGGKHHGVGVQGVVGALLLVPQLQGVRTRRRVPGRTGKRRVRQQPGIDHAGEALGVEEVVDGIDELGVDALVQVLLALDEAVALILRERVEIVHVLRRRHLQRELGVLEREEPARAGDPVQLVPVDVDLLQQFVVDLRGALAAAHDRDAPLLLQFTLPRQVIGVVEDQPAAVHNRVAGRRNMGRGAGAQHQPPRVQHLGTVRDLPRRAGTRRRRN